MKHKAHLTASDLYNFYGKWPNYLLFDIVRI
jgi:hypothetical protein